MQREQLPRTERRLAVVMSADVAGYSRLAHEHETDTVERLTRIMRLVEEAVSNRKGRVVSTAGDGVLAEFGAATDAAFCAIDIQREVGKRNRRIEKDQQMLLRIGLNIGDVYAQDDDVLGDAVNVAARVQALADPGAILATRAFIDLVRGKVPCEFLPLGLRRVKNIARPVRVFRFVTEESPAPLQSERWRLLVWAGGAGVAALALLAIIVAALNHGSLDPSGPSDSRSEAFGPPASGSRPTPQAKPAPPSSAETRRNEPIAIPPPERPAAEDKFGL